MIGFFTLNQEATKVNADGFLVNELGRLTTEHGKTILSNSSISACNPSREIVASIFPESSWSGYGHEHLFSGPVPKLLCVGLLPQSVHPKIRTQG